MHSLTESRIDMSFPKPICDKDKGDQHEILKYNTICNNSFNLI